MKADGMRCPYCKTDNDRVIDSRGSEDLFSIRRRRECISCKRRYTTYERLEEPVVKVVKKDGIREDFSREKIRSGLQRACWKRPIKDDTINQIVTEIETFVYQDEAREISSTALGNLVMERLAKIDQVAYVRFASVYREFKDVNDFVDELRPMLRERENQNRTES
jgi:transcriptional repressor NrdR